MGTLVVLKVEAITLPPLVPTGVGSGWLEGKRLSTSRDYGVVTFDCCGTLIDWESGIRAAFKKSIEGAELSGLQESRVFELYEAEEKRVEAGTTFRLYRDVLSLAGAQSSCVTFALTNRFL